MSPAPRKYRLARARCDAPRSRQGTRSGTPSPRRGATRTARTPPAAVSRIADARAPEVDRRLQELGRRKCLRPGLLHLDLAASDSWRSSFGTRIRAYGTTRPARETRVRLTT